MGRLPQTTEASTREDCTGASRDVSEKLDAVGSGGNLHALLHVLPHHQLRGNREGEGQRHPGPWRTQVSASQSVCRTRQSQAWPRQNRSPTRCWDQESQAERSERNPRQEDRPPRFLKHLPTHHFVKGRDTMTS